MVADLVGKMRAGGGPLVHCITNYVSMDIMANVLLAAGMSPAMVHAELEAPEFAGISSAVSINVGTLLPRARLHRLRRRVVDSLVEHAWTGSSSWRRAKKGQVEKGRREACTRRSFCKRRASAHTICATLLASRRAHSGRRGAHLSRRL